MESRKMLEEVIKKIEETEKILIELKEDMYSILLKYQESPDLDQLGREKMEKLEPIKNTQILNIYRRAKNNLPHIFEKISNIERHFYFNELCDWFDIVNHDIPQLLEYLSNLKIIYNFMISLINNNKIHFKIEEAIKAIFITLDFDSLLKSIFSKLESYIRDELNEHIEEKSNTLNMIGIAFKQGILNCPYNTNFYNYNDHIRNILQGVIGFYRNYFSHTSGLGKRFNDIFTVVSLIILCNEMFNLFDECNTRRRYIVFSKF